MSSRDIFRHSYTVIAGGLRSVRSIDSCKFRWWFCGCLVDGAWRCTVSRRWSFWVVFFTRLNLSKTRLSPQLRSKCPRRTWLECSWLECSGRFMGWDGAGGVPRATFSVWGTFRGSVMGGFRVRRDCPCWRRYSWHRSPCRQWSGHQ